MAYSIIEQTTRDLDIFLFDGIKTIHIATAGGLLPEKIAETDINFDVVLYTINSFRRVFETIRNDNLVRGNWVNQEMYFKSFERISKRGFYSYDKVDINNVEDQKYQLVSTPYYDRTIYITKFDFSIQPDEIMKYGLNLNIDMIRTSKEFPTNNQEFDILEYI